MSGPVPAVRDPAFAEALRRRRFRGIEKAASEELSVGWVTPLDPTGATFEPDDLDFDAGVWLRMRIDRKKLPPAWVAIHRSVAERSAGRPLTAREKRELAEGLMARVLPGVLPAVTLVDAVYLPAAGTVLLFAASRGAKEAFDKLMRESFGVTLEPAGPYELAAGKARLDRSRRAYLDQVSPVPWPDPARRRTTSAPPQAEIAEEG